MHTILIIGTGKSSTFLIEYLANTAMEKNRKIILADQNIEHIYQKYKDDQGVLVKKIDLDNNESRRSLIQKADIVVSMLPAFLHPIIAKDCLSFSKHFFTASYESADLRKMADEIKEKNLLFLNECGLDPGLDHMSAMKIIHKEINDGNEILSFKSYTGGVLAPESEDNPWKYKFTWNPRNVVLAGQGVSRFIRNGQYKYVPYHMLFRRIENIHFENVGSFEGYPNRDSLSYRSIYGLKEVPTMLRGTLRRAGFCQSWDVFVQLGITDDSFEMNLPDHYSKRMFLNAFLPYHTENDVEIKLVELLPWVNDEILKKIEWLGLFSEEELPQKKGSPAAILQVILEEKWELKASDKDMIVMQHLFEIKTNQGIKSVISSLVCKGENQTKTAMAKTVGLPLAMAIDLFLEGKIEAKGLQLPITPEIYEPILDLLEKENIKFTESSTLKND
ncbi:saccharopine dehydrogenase NADP-binding domain-containing protein [Belliella sp. DSM 111904]|uniref:Saccharopine dehydrogenase NADP-binding domain-containing protein n=1 Tax=Belliella filtrata TaxID=2923435 RepID=A0ABS9UX92_9BACT|nr:saccharopine dehydrogenase C-terminal domain-containing protein [Belliella filtrata]MCH7408783.1 saccharopine dehydrogenase NADP-binding domain-containing protein [Belliella filtrata]